MTNEPAGPAEDYTKTTAFKLLANDPKARVVVSCEYSVPLELEGNSYMLI